jgi:hypothetical protein
MKISSTVTFAVCIAVLATAGESLAQRGPGSIQPPRPRATPGGSAAGSRGSGLGTLMEDSVESIGQVTGAERFVRGNRAADDFVGSDSGDQAGFVGSSTAANDGPIQSATTGALVAPTTPPAINRTRARSPAPYMYEARLRVGFQVFRQPLAIRETKVAQRLALARVIDPASLIVVKLEGSTAILSGVVGSAREKSLTGMLLTFEPGISNVRNELMVRPPSMVPSRSPSDPEPPKPGDS